MSQKVQSKKNARAFKNDRTEDYGYDKDEFKRYVKKERKNKNLRLAYELEVFE